jgi:hypothetical protein
MVSSDITLRDGRAVHLRATALPTRQSSSRRSSA